MNLALTDDQQMIREEAARYLAEHASSARIRATIAAGAAYDQALWDGIAREVGWCGLTIPEEFGGLGLGASELTLVLEQMGHRLGGSPYFSSAAATALIAAVANGEARRSLLTAAATGARMAIAFPALATSEPLAGGNAIIVERVGDSYELNGDIAFVADLPAAELGLVPAMTRDGERHLFALAPGSDFSAERLNTLDLTRSAAALSFKNARIDASRRIDDPERWRQAAGALDVILLALAAEDLGAAQGCFDLTLAYISERKQFGRSIASFQAIKHRCARLSIEIEIARSMVAGAAAALDADGHSTTVGLDIAAARAMTAEILFAVATEAIQLHGGAGCAWEYDPHLYLRRAQTTKSWFGGARAQHARIADALLAA